MSSIYAFTYIGAAYIWPFVFEPNRQKPNLSTLFSKSLLLKIPFTECNYLQGQEFLSTGYLVLHYLNELVELSYLRGKGKLT